MNYNDLEGKYEFRFDEEKNPGYLLLDINIPKFLSTSLIDVDIHPKHISVIIKSKILRLTLPAEVKANESSAQRSTTTGSLLIKMPKCDPDENMVGIRMQQHYMSQKEVPERKKSSKLVNDMLQQGGKSLNKKKKQINETDKPQKIENAMKSSNIGLYEFQTKFKVASQKPTPQDVDTVDCLHSSSYDDEDDPPPLY